MKELKIIIRYSLNSFQTVLSNPIIFFLFLFSKIIRLGLFVMFLSFLFRGVSGLMGFSRDQIIFFFLSFNLIDTIAQLMFREVYRFRPLIVSGNFDFVLSKPVNPLIRVLFGGPDIIDVAMLFIILSVTAWFAICHFHPSSTSWLTYVLLIVNGLVISASFHILVLAIGILTLSVDHLIMIYRDLTALMRIPVDLYIEPIRFILTFLIPLGIMLTFPAKALLGLLSLQNILFSFIFALSTLYLALKFWHFSLRHYSSASS